MANRYRGEISAELGGSSRTLVLTLGALAELEDAFACDSMAGVVKRFESGQLSARDLICILGAGLRGAGESIRDEEVARLSVPDGAAGYVRIARALLEATFGGSGGVPSKEEEAPHPFPGKR